MTADELQKFLDELGSRLTPAASHVWELAVRQQIIEAITGLTLAVFALLIAAWLWRKASVLGQEHRDDDSASMARFAAGATAIGAVVYATSCVTTLLNPEWHALTDLVGRLKP